jgi:hypothetical protein
MRLAPRGRGVGNITPAAAGGLRLQEAGWRLPRRGFAAATAHEPTETSVSRGIDPIVSCAATRPAPTVTDAGSVGSAGIVTGIEGAGS